MLRKVVSTSNIEVPLSAIAYLRDLQSQFLDIYAAQHANLGSSDLIQRRRHLFEQAGLGNVYWQVISSLTSLEVVEKGYREHLIAPFLACIPKHEADMLRSVHVGLLQTFDPNAWAIQTPSGEELVVLHAELPYILSFHAEVQAAIGKLLRKGQASEVAALADWGLDFVCSKFGEPTYSPYPLVDVELDFTEFMQVQQLTMAYELFVIAHEFAHIVLGHTAKLAEVPLRLAGLKVQKMTWDHKLELDADIKAIRWLHGLNKDNDNIFIRFVALYPLICCEVLVLLDFINVHFGSFGPTSTHPTALARLEHIASEGQELMTGHEQIELATWIEHVSLNRLAHLP